MWTLPTPMARGSPHCLLLTSTAERAPVCLGAGGACPHLSRCVRVCSCTCQQPGLQGPASAQHTRRSQQLTQVVRDVAQVRLHHGRVQRQVVPQQLEVPRVVFKVRLWGTGARQGQSAFRGSAGASERVCHALLEPLQCWSPTSLKCHVCGDTALPARQPRPTRSPRRAPCGPPPANMCLCLAGPQGALPTACPEDKLHSGSHASSTDTKPHLEPLRVQKLLLDLLQPCLSNSLFGHRAHGVLRVHTKDQDGSGAGHCPVLPCACLSAQWQGPNRGDSPPTRPQTPLTRQR